MRLQRKKVQVEEETPEPQEIRKETPTPSEEELFPRALSGVQTTATSRTEVCETAAERAGEKPFGTNPTRETLPAAQPEEGQHPNTPGAERNTEDED